MADQEYIVRVPHAFGTDEHFEKIFNGDTASEDAHALNDALNKARGASKVIKIEGKYVFPDALSLVMVREVTDFDVVLKAAEDHQKAVEKARQEALAREAESLRSRADSLTQQADSKSPKSDVTTAHETGATTDSDGAGSRV